MPSSPPYDTQSAVYQHTGAGFLTAVKDKALRAARLESRLLLLCMHAHARARMRTRLSRLATLHPENTSRAVSHNAKRQGTSGMGTTRVGMPFCLQVCAELLPHHTSGARLTSSLRSSDALLA